MGGPLFSPVVDGRKTCSRCGIEKPVSEFYARTPERGGYQAACRACGLLCGHCNRMLGYARDSVETLRHAIDYLGGDR